MAALVGPYVKGEDATGASGGGATCRGSRQEAVGEGEGQQGQRGGGQAGRQGGRGGMGQARSVSRSKVGGAQAGRQAGGVGGSGEVRQQQRATGRGAP